MYRVAVALVILSLRREETARGRPKGVGAESRGAVQLIELYVVDEFFFQTTIRPIYA